MPEADNEVVAGRPNARRKVMGIFYRGATTPRLKEKARRRRKLINYYVYMLLTECLKIVKKMCAVRLLIINVKLSTGSYFY